MNTIYLTTLLFFAALALLWFIHFWLYKDFAVEHFRQRMFELRDKLFDEANDGLIDFDHPAYGVLRRTMNGAIRYAHQVNILSMIIEIFITRNYEGVKKNEYDFQCRFSKTLKGLDKETQERLEQYKRKMGLILLNFILMESPIFFLIAGLITFFLILPLLFFLGLFKRIKKRAENLVNIELNNLQSEAFEIGRL